MFFSEEQSCIGIRRRHRHYCCGHQTPFGGEERKKLSAARPKVVVICEHVCKARIPVLLTSALSAEEVLLVWLRQVADVLSSMLMTSVCNKSARPCVRIEGPCTNCQIKNFIQIRSFVPRSLIHYLTLLGRRVLFSVPSGP